MIPAFPKIFHLGDKYTTNIFEGLVEITEKVDGSQFSFGKIDGELFIRSKGQQIFEDAVPKMFNIGFDYVMSIKDKIPNNMIFYGEYLNKPKHNVLCYERVPANNIILFGICTPDKTFKTNLNNWVNHLHLDFETVPVLFDGEIKSMEEVYDLINMDSCLGGTKVEGIVVKNYDKDLMCGGMVVPLMCAKYVSEAFKEKHGLNWRKENTSGGKWESFKESFKSEARWQKAVIHLKERNELLSEPKDIGHLIKEVNIDITKECKEEIIEFLWKFYGQDVLRNATKGLAQWYKNELAKNCLIGDDDK